MYVQTWYAACAALLGVAASSDVAQRRIPNAVVVALAALGVAMHWRAEGAAYAGWSVAAAMVLGAVLTVPWRAGRLGGGDVKLATAAAVCVGPAELTEFVFATAFLGGGVAALSLVAARRRLATAGAFGGPAPDLRSALQATTPYGAAIAAGAVYALVLGGRP